METQKITVEFVREALPPRRADGHKGDFGKVLIAGGAVGYTGAPYLAALGAARSGCGLVYLGVPSCIWTVTAAKCVCAMPFPLPEEGGMLAERAAAPLLERLAGCEVLALGPGLGRSAQTQALTLALLKTEKPVVLDADGINALAGHLDVLDGRKAPTVLTPHEGEFARLTGCGLPVRERVEAAQRFAAAHRCTMVLKGYGTVTAAPDGRVWVNPTGNPGMAKGGSGDVLAGMTAALWGQKLLRREENDLPRLAAAAVYYHGLAGDLCARRLGEYAMLPGDMIEALPEVLKGQED